MTTTQKTRTAEAPVEDVVADLAKQRDHAAAHRNDELARITAEAEHNRNRADVAEATRRAELDRAEREASASAAAGLSRLYREARAAGERSRVAAHLARSGEVRALRLERLRILNLRVLIPVLLGFAAWSTTGVQQGAARLMQVTDTDLTWFALWILEPVLIGAVAWVITARARLAASGGKLDKRAETIAWSCLATSIVLNLVAAVPPGYPAGHWDVSAVLALIGSMFAHAVGPVGAAATAHLIGIVDASIAEADPWTDEQGKPVPLLADLTLTGVDSVTGPAAVVVGQVDAEPFFPEPGKSPVVEQLAEEAPVEEADTDELIDELFARSVKAFADDLFGGQVPGIRAIKTRLKVGQARAQEVQTYLSGLVSN